MTAALYRRAAEDIDALIVAWLAPLGRAAVERRPNDPLPFRRVQHITGTESVDMEIADPVVSVHTLCARSGGLAAAKDTARDTHRRMLELAVYTDLIALSDRDAAVDYVNVFQSPIFTPYEDEQIYQVSGRYQIGLTYVQVSS